MTVHFLSEKSHLVLTTYWWVITYLFFHSISMSSTWRHRFVDFDWFRQLFWPPFALKLLFFKPLSGTRRYINPLMVKPFRLTYLAGGSLNCLPDLLLIVDLQTHHRSTRIQIKGCQNLWNAQDRRSWSCGIWTISAICRNYKKKWWKSAITLSLGNLMTWKAQVRCKEIETTLQYQIFVCCW